MQKEIKHNTELLFDLSNPPMKTGLFNKEKHLHEGIYLFYS